MDKVGALYERNGEDGVCFTRASYGAELGLFSSLSHFRQRGEHTNTLPISEVSTKDEPWFARLYPCSAGSPAVVCKPSLGSTERHKHVEDIQSACT